MDFLAQHPIIGIFMVAWVSADLLTWLVRSVARRSGVLDVPGGHKQHDRPVPTLGGLALYGAFTAALAVSHHLTPAFQAILMGGGIIVAVGAMDDLRGVSAVVKLAVIGVATAWLVRADIVIEMGLPLALAALATFLWIGFVTSAFNAVDNTDGVASGLAAITAATVFAIAWATWQHELAIVAAGLCAACLGFLRHNYHPASIFLGDSGSFFLGFAVSAMLVLGQWSNSPIKAALLPVVVLGMPIFDFLLILVLRGLDGKYHSLVDPIVMCARDHTAHRLQALGLSVRETALVMYLGAVTCSSAAVWMLNLDLGSTIVLFGGLVAVFLAAATGLRVVELKGRREPSPVPSFVASALET